ncbi:DNA topoisomerase 3-alpha isoform X2 [Coffea arabica]|uniref:DNA topoisomerase n=1 Tax=Coffea arabica TaxID=13443 RepID=A0ABM4V4E8_COFAR
MAYGGGGGGGGSGGRAIRVLNVAEKPSVAKAVSGFLSKNQQGGLRVRDGRSRYNKIFEFNHTVNGQPCHMSFTSVTGHLMELDFDDRFRRWHSCDPVDLYRAPVRKFVPEDKSDIRRTLEEEARKCQWLILWLDCDREGENIAFEVIEVCTQANRNLNVWRARFSALIEREIQNSVQNLVRPNQLFADAVDLRQFPTLGFVVERYWENQSHEAEEFWTINCTHNTDEGTANFKWMRGHFFDYTCAAIVYEMCIQEPTVTVTEIKEQEKLKYPPLPLSTLELEKRASRFFHMSPAHTMKVAEDLYQAGFISYPRTETDRFSEKTDLRAIVFEQQGHPLWGSYAQLLLNPEAGLWRNPSSGRHDDKAHPPIHPTRFSPGESGWSRDHHRLYELVVRHFLACVSQPAKAAETSVEIDIAGEAFSSSGRVIHAKNYLDVYTFESWGGSMIPTYTLGQQFMPTTLTLDSGVTRPPPLLSEADLLTCMDKAGIGTDATMHEHIQKLLDRHYAIKTPDIRFSPTNLGEALVMGYDDMGYELWKPYLRAMMESDMKAVSIGTKRKTEVLETCLQQMKACFIDARANKGKLFEAMAIFFERSNRSNDNQHNTGGDVVRKCSICHESDMVLKQKPDGHFMVGCLGFPQCRNVVWLPGSISQAAVTHDICGICTPGPVFKIQFKFRRLEIPPNYNVDHLGCIGGCDDTLRQLVEICGTGARTASSVSGRGQGATSSNSAQRSSSRGRMACVYCRQTGHSSDFCPSQPSRSHTARNQETNPPNGESSIHCNSCGEPCVLRTANTATNRGRKFFSCQSQGCNFFIWEDSMNGASSVSRANARSFASNPSRRGGRGSRTGGRASGAAFVSATGEPISGRCFNCGDPSHFANVCPNRGR